jgi:hypothetical protein
MISTTRRAALATSGRAAVVALPFGAAAATIMVTSPLAAAAGTDPHIAWWAELKRLDQAISDASNTPAEHDLILQQNALADLIVETAPTTPEAAAIIATVLLGWQEVSGQSRSGVGLDLDEEAGRTLAQWVLASSSSDVLRRAGLDAASG